jgi:hypothetical protein
MKKIIHSTLVIGFLSISSCAFVSHYDSLSYKQLTDLKGEEKVFFENCKKEGASGEKALSTLNDFKVKSSKAYEYEKGKSLNDDTVAQLEIIDKTMTDVLNRYKSNDISEGKCLERNDEKTNATTGCLTEGYCTGKWLAISSKFDIAISTENLKIRNK